MTKEIKDAVERIKNNYNPQRIVLFGSHATGKANKYSDIDFFVVKNTREQFLKRVRRVRKIVGYSMPCDLIIYTPNEVKQAQDSHFLKEIIKTGKVLYEK